MPRKTVGLSDRHRKIMEFLTTFVEKNSYSPSIRQIGESIGVKSTSLVDYYLNYLEQEGYIARDGRVSRSIRVFKPVYPEAGGPSLNPEILHGQNMSGSLSDILRIPVFGRIVASAPLPMPPSDLAYFDPESSVEIARSLLPPREKINELFALEVDGDSMIDAMVNDGDIVVMKHAQDAVNGDMVAVWLDDENSTTLKYFYKENNRVRLQPANPSMKPILIDDPSSLRIMGKVVMVIRQVKSVAV
ncbi:MAG: repressor LexA [Leptolinea sp.]|jgi:repressor LexA|nr:repressor LexA [Leptolinea sp.]